MLIVKEDLARWTTSSPRNEASWQPRMQPTSFLLAVWDHQSGSGVPCVMWRPGWPKGGRQPTQQLAWLAAPQKRTTITALYGICGNVCRLWNVCRLRLCRLHSLLLLLFLLLLKPVHIHTAPPPRMINKQKDVGFCSATKIYTRHPGDVQFTENKCVMCLTSLHHTLKVVMGFKNQSQKRAVFINMISMMRARKARERKHFLSCTVPARM